MAISVDTVYQKVLAFANKEQRGYITPQEFNLFADQAQMEIFEQYFYDINQFRRIPGNDSKYADMVDVLEDKLTHFKQGPTDILHGTPISGLSSDVPNLFYRLGDVSHASNIAEEIRYEDFFKMQTAPLTKATSSRPIYWRKDGKIYFYPDTLKDTIVDMNETTNMQTGFAIVSSDTAHWDGSLASQKSYIRNVMRDEDIIAGKEYKLELEISNYTGTKEVGVREEGGVSGNAVMTSNGYYTEDFISTDGSRLDLFGRPANTADIKLTIREIISKCSANWIRKPKKVNWGYVVVKDKALYNVDTSTDFDLHPSEESELVYRILAFAGIAIEKPQLTQVAAGLEQVKVQQEKQ